MRSRSRVVPSSRLNWERLLLYTASAWISFPRAVSQVTLHLQYRVGGAFSLFELFLFSGQRILRVLSGRRVWRQRLRRQTVLA